MIEARGLGMRYGTFIALQEASFRAQPGQVLGLLGPNGAGKTTTMRILTSFQVPSEGTALVAGFDVVAQPLEVRRRTGYLPETLPLYTAMEVRECLEFVGRARGLRGHDLRARVGWVVGKCGLDAVFHTPVLELSKGFRQRTALAQALVHDPEVVILDEPTSGLDPHQILEIRALVRELAATKTVLLSTHILQEASALADRLLVMSRGRIVGAGTADELLTQAGVRPRVRVVFSEATVEVADRLRSIEQAGDVRPTAAPGAFEVEERAPGLAEAIGKVARLSNWTVVELRRDAGSLEEVFLTLTRRAGPEESPAATPAEAAA